MKIIDWKTKCTCSICIRKVSFELESNPDLPVASTSSLSPTISPATPSLPIASTSSQRTPSILLPNELLSIIFDLARPPIPERTHRKRSITPAWKTYNRLNLVCKDWSSCGSRSQINEVIIRSQKQLRKLLEVIESGLIDSSRIKKIILDVKVVGEIEDEEGDESEILSLLGKCQNVEELITIGFGFKGLVNIRPADSMPIFPSVKRFVYTPIDDSNSRISLPTLILLIIPLFPNLIHVELNRHAPFAPIGSPLLLTELGEASHYGALGIFLPFSIFTSENWHLTSLVLTQLRIPTMNVIIFLAFLSPTLETVELLDMALENSILGEALVSTRAGSNLKSFAYSSQPGYFPLPASIFWSLVNSYPKLEVLSLRDSSLFYDTQYRKIPIDLVEFRIGTEFVVENEDVQNWLDYLIDLKLAKLKKIGMSFRKGSEINSAERKVLFREAKEAGASLSFTELYIVDVSDNLEMTLPLRLALFGLE